MSCLQTIDKCWQATWWTWKRSAAVPRLLITRWCSSHHRALCQSLTEHSVPSGATGSLELGTIFRKAKLVSSLMKIGFGMYLWDDWIFMYFMYCCGTVSKIFQVRKSKMQECATSFAQKVWGTSLHPHVCIYGSSLEVSSSAQATLGSSFHSTLAL